VLVQLLQNVALVVEPLFQRQPETTGSDLERPRRGWIPDVLLVSAAQLDLVATPFRYEQPCLRTGLLDHRVIRRRCAVDDQIGFREEVAQLHAALLGELAQPLHHADRLVFGRRAMLPEREAALRVDDEEVGERPTDVDADPVPHSQILSMTAAEPRPPPAHTVTMP